MGCRLTFRMGIYNASICRSQSQMGISSSFYMPVLQPDGHIPRLHMPILKADGNKELLYMPIRKRAVSLRAFPVRAWPGSPLEILFTLSTTCSTGRGRAGSRASAHFARRHDATPPRRKGKGPFGRFVVPSCAADTGQVRQSPSIQTASKTMRSPGPPDHPPLKTSGTSTSGDSPCAVPLRPAPG